MPGGKYSATKIRRAERQALALELRKTGLSFRSVAAAIKEQAPDLLKTPNGRQLAYSDVLAYRDVCSHFEALRARNVVNGDMLLDLELSRLDDIINSVWAYLFGDDFNTRVVSGNLVLRAMERRAKFLGLDAPERREVAGPDGGPVEVLNVPSIISDSESRRLISRLLDTRAVGLLEPGTSGNAREPGTVDAGQTPDGAEPETA